MSIKIAINTRLLLSGRLEGLGWFTFQTFRRIVQNHPEVEFHFIFDRRFDEQFIFAKNIEPIVLFPPARHPALFYLFFEQAIPAYLNKIKPDLFISPDGLLSMAYKGKQLPVFHDLNFMHYPDNLPWLSSKYYRWFFPRYASIAHRIVTVSEFSKNDIIKTFNYPAERVDVVYNGANDSFKPASEEAALQTRLKYTGGVPYFVYVGSLHKRKNIDNMLLAFDLFRATGKHNHKLVIVGEPMFGKGWLKPLLQTIQHRDDVVFTGRLFNNELSQVVASAQALLLVSFFEGFGIPVLEAMHCDVAVITSNITSLPEVAGNAALLVNPHSAESIASAMLAIANDEKLQHTLIENGRMVRQNFSWDQTANLMWNSIMQCVGSL